MKKRCQTCGAIYEGAVKVCSQCGGVVLPENQEEKPLEKRDQRCTAPGCNRKVPKRKHRAGVTFAWMGDYLKLYCNTCVRRKAKKHSEMLGDKKDFWSKTMFVPKNKNIPFIRFK